MKNKQKREGGSRNYFELCFLSTSLSSLFFYFVFPFIFIFFFIMCVCVTSPSLTLTSRTKDCTRNDEAYPPFPLAVHSPCYCFFIFIFACDMEGTE